MQGLDNVRDDSEAVLFWVVAVCTDLVDIVACSASPAVLQLGLDRSSSMSFSSLGPR